MNGLTFAQPEWFWGWISLLPLLLLRISSQVRASRQLPGLVSPRLSHLLINGANQARRWTTFLLQSLAIACLIAALARPQLGFEEVETEIDARNLLIAIDTSRSMMSDDLPPHRLARTKLAAKDIVLSLPDDRIGLIAFAGKPFLQAPLTVDHEAVIEAIDQLDTEIIPRGGTNLSAAVTLALETVNEAKLGPSALVLFSDGEALEGLEEIERVRDQAAAAGLAILTVGVGTTDGSIIPEADEDGLIIPGAFVKDENGQVVRTRLTPEPLQALAAKGGIYLHLGGPASLSRVVDQIRAGLASSREGDEARRRPLERFLWPLSAAFGFLVLSHLVPLLWLKPSAVRNAAFRENRALALAALLLLSPAALAAADPLRSGHEAYSREDYASALSAYEGTLSEKLPARARSRLQMGIGAAAYRLGNFERAAEAYGAALAEGDTDLRREALYNLGNTLYRRGEAALIPAPDKPRDPDQLQALSAPEDAVGRAKREWEGAIEHFESSLALDPDNPRTRHNLDYVKKRLEELKEQEEQQKEEQEKDGEKKEEEEKKDDPKDQEEKKDDPQDSSGEKDQPESGDTPPKDPQDQPGQEEPKDPGEEKPGQDPKEPGEDPDKEKNPGESEPPKDGDQPGQAPPEEPEAPKDGKLEANPNQSQPPQGNPGQPQEREANPADLRQNPQTGYSPTEARGLLDALADETEVRPLLQPARGEKFKNW